MRGLSLEWKVMLKLIQINKVQVWDWIKLAQDRDQWRVTMLTVTNFRDP